MQVRIIIFRCTLWYNSLDDPTRQYEVWSLKENTSTNWSDRKHIIQRIFHLMEGGTNICQKFWWVSLCLQKHSDGMPCTGLKCLNANFISYATQLPGGGGHFFFKIWFFFVTIYTYKLLQAFPPKASVENSSAQWAIFFYLNSSVLSIDTIFGGWVVQTLVILQSYTVYHVHSTYSDVCTVTIANIFINWSIVSLLVLFVISCVFSIFDLII